MEESFELLNQIIEYICGNKENNKMPEVLILLVSITIINFDKKEV